MPQFVPQSRRAAGLPSALPAPESHECISFDSGHAFPGILPDLSLVAQRALGTHRTQMLQYGERPGLREMREWISAYLKSDQAEVAADEVLVVNGAKHGIDLICRLLLDEGDSIVVTAPTYYTALPIFRSFGVEFIEVGQDAEGILVDQIAEAVQWLHRSGRASPKFIYNVPDFHNPTGITMSRRRREALIELAERHGVYVVEDSPYRHLRYEGRTEPSLKSLDRSGVVLHLGTFSKILAPGLRIGWIAGQCDLIGRLLQLKSDGGTSPLVQRLIVDFLAEGRHARHLQLAQETYRRHRDRMLRALERDIPEVTSNVPEGGYYLWLSLPGSANGNELAQRAREFGVTVYPGSKFYAAQSGGYPGNAAPETDHVRLTFSHAGPEEIDEGVSRLASAWASLRK